MDEILRDSAERGIRYLGALGERRVSPEARAVEGLSAFDFPLPEAPTAPEKVLALLDQSGSPATVATAGRRYFGFVTGGVLPAALAANWLAGAWDQNAFGMVASPIGSYLEEVALNWLVDLLGLPPGTGFGITTGATMANFSGLLAARRALLERQGWDVEKDGLFGAPQIKVVVGDEVHASMLKALGMAGFGRERVIRLPVDDQGRIRPEALPPLDETALLCIQAGNVNSGAFDPAAEIVPAAKEAGAWVHVDGAFGLWAAASPEYAHLMAGYAGADSWATDAHKWLNVPYDCGLVFVREPEHLAGALSVRGAYLLRGDRREADDFTPEMSRRARGLEVWAALYSLGRRGLAEMIDRNCRQAQQMAAGLQEAGFEVLNEVVLNQVAVSFGSPEFTKGVIAAIQEEGTFWAGSTQWQGRTAMRISFSSWATRDEDVERSLDAVKRVAKRLRLE